MRDILFRGKKLWDGEWAESRCPGGTMSSGVLTYDFDPETVGQYIGLTDMYDKKIFEGDIIHCYGSFLDGPGVVKWDNDSAAFIVESIEAIDEFDNLDTVEDVEIIGNIHDNPELLEATK